MPIFNGRSIRAKRYAGYLSSQKFRPLSQTPTIGTPFISPDHYCRARNGYDITIMASISPIAEHNTAPVKCTNCEDKFTTIESVMKHRRDTGHTVPLLQCPEDGCTFEAVRHAVLTEHVNGGNHISRWVSETVSVQVCLSDLLTVTRTAALLDFEFP